MEDKTGGGKGEVRKGGGEGRGVIAGGPEPMGGPAHGLQRRQCQIWKEDLRAAEDILEMMNLIWRRGKPRARRKRRVEQPTKPRLPTSNWKAWTRQPRTRHSASRARYRATFLTCASRIFSSRGQVSSPQMTVRVESDQITMSGRRAVVAMAGGKVRPRPRSRRSSQSIADLKRRGGSGPRERERGRGAAPAGTKLIRLARDGGRRFSLEINHGGRGRRTQARCRASKHSAPAARRQHIH